MKKNIRLRMACLALLMLTGVIVFTACKKNTNEKQMNEEFDVAASKEWFYRTFKKSGEFFAVNTTTAGKKIPDWKTGRYKKMGNTEMVEYDLTEQKKGVMLKPSGNWLNDDRVAQATTSRALFIKRGNTITLKLVQYIPELNYLTACNYDISKNGVINPDEKFTGKMLITNWNGDLVKGYNVENGRIKSIIKHIIKQANRSGGDNGLPNTPINPDCTYAYLAWLEQDCTIIPLGDNIVLENCGNWNVLWDNLMETSCPLTSNDCADLGLGTEDCMCQLLALGCNSGGDEEGCNAQVASFEDAVSETIPANSQSMVASYNGGELYHVVEWIVTRHYADLWRVKVQTECRYQGYYENGTYKTDVKVVNTFSSAYEGTNNIVSTTWTQTSKNDQIYNNKTTLVSSVSTINGKLHHEANIPGCNYVLRRDKTISNSVTLEYKG